MSDYLWADSHKYYYTSVLYVGEQSHKNMHQVIYQVGDQKQKRTLESQLPVLCSDHGSLSLFHKVKEHVY